MSTDGAPRRRKELEPCGSHAAHQRHVRAKEEACDACKAAHAAYVKVRRGAQLAALRLLAERHPGEFASLLEATRWEAGLR